MLANSQCIVLQDKALFSLPLRDRLAHLPKNSYFSVKIQKVSCVEPKRLNATLTKNNMKRIDFFREGLRNLQTVGTITRSSRHLCKGMVKHVDFQKAKLIVELGAGDGVITRHILANMRPDAKLLAFEVNAKFCDQMREIQDDRLVVIEDSAEYIERYLHEAGATEIDYVISAIPFVALPKAVGELIVGQAHQFLKNKGLYIQVHYSLVMKQLYLSVFGNVDINFVALNVPPAFVLVSEKR